MPEITLVFNDEGDWMGVYLRGKLVYEGHSIGPTHLLDLIGLSYSTIDGLGMAALNLSRLPDDLQELES
jgi:hypothetical protein